MSEESPLLPKKGEKKLVNLLSDLLSFPSTDWQPEAKAHRLNLYESMSPALGNELNLAPAAPLQGSQQDKRSVIYENCFKCQGAHCHPPPRVTPAKMYRSRGISAFQTFPTELHLKKSQEPDSAADEEPLNQALRGVDGQCQREEINGQTVNEGKRHLSNGLVTLWCPFSSDSLRWSSLCPLLPVFHQ